MDFGKLLKTYHQNSPKSTVPKWIVISSMSIVITAVVSITVYFYEQNSSVAPNSHKESQLAASIDTAAMIAAQENKPSQQKKIEEKIEKNQPKKLTAVSQKGHANDSLTNEKPLIPQFTEATPVDGYPSLYAYFDKELKYPIAPTDSIQGIVSVSFVITKTGTPDLIKIENSLGEAFDAECIRVIQNMPPWKPATMYGKPVQTKMSIPLSFKIKK